VTMKTGTRARRAYHHGDLRNALLNAALDGSLTNVQMRTDPQFKFRVPVADS